MFLHRIGSRNTVPPRILRIVPLGLSHIFFSLNSVKGKNSHDMEIFPVRVSFQNTAVLYLAFVILPHAQNCILLLVM